MANINSLEDLHATKGFKIIHLNVRSLPKNIDQLRLMLHDSNLDVITLSETWLKTHLSTKIVELIGYKPFRLDRSVGSGRAKSKTSKKNKNGGGLLTFVHDKYASSTESHDVLNISNEHIEAQWIRINRPNCKDVVVCNVYRPPTGVLAKAVTYFEDCLVTLNLRKSDIFILGDMNVNYMNKKSPDYKKLDFFVRSNGLTQCISNTTRNTDKTKSLIDLVLTNSKFIKSAGTLEHHISDHQPIFVIHKKSRDRRMTAEFKGRSYRNFDKNVFHNMLSEVDWDTFYDITDVDDSWDFLLVQISVILDQLCPIRSFRIRNYRPDWMTKELIEQIKDRDYFYRRAKKTGDKDVWNIAKFLRNTVNTNIRRAKRDFILKELRHNENNAKKFWKTIKSVLPTDKEGLNNDIMLKEGEDRIGREDVASFINNFFINVGKLDKSRVLFTGNLGDSGETQEDLTPYSSDKVTEREVYGVIKRINVSKSSGIDNISSSVFKVAFEYLIPEITHMYNLSIGTAKFPNLWKKALVIPIPKKGDLTRVQNYRPISLLPLPGKVMEKLIHQRLSTHLETNSLLANEQHGFRKAHSTVHSIAQLTNYIYRDLDEKSPTLAVFIDFKKAFDCVQHPVLLKKLEAMNLDVLGIDWIKDYLTRRQQRVFANGSYSSYQDISQGVPQGSVLGPLFYIIYANDLTDIVKNCKIAMYADDTVLYISCKKNFELSVKKLQEDIDSLSQWCVGNGITANVEKTKVMVFGSNNSLANIPQFDIKFGGVALQMVSSYMYLGILLDNKLTYNLYVNRIIGSFTAKLKQFRRMRGFLSTKAALMVYKGMLLPILEYGDIFLVGTSATNRKRLQVLQNKGLRCALGRDHDSNVRDLHNDANLLKLKFRREQHILNYMYDFAQVEGNIRPKSKSSIKTRSSNKLFLKTKRPHTEKFRKSLAYRGPKTWNDLREEFHHTPSKSVYKTMITNLITKKAALNESLENSLLMT